MDDFLVTERHPPEGFRALTVGKFLDAQHSVLAASASSLHLYVIQPLGPDEEVLVPISVLNLFGHITAVHSLPSGDLELPDRALALLISGDLAVVEVRDKRLRVVSWHRIPTNIDDPAEFLAVHGDCVAVCSNFGRVTMLQATRDAGAPPLHLIASFHLRDFASDAVMPSGGERVTDLFLTEMATGATSPDGSPGKMLWVPLESAQESHTFSWLAATRVAAVAWPPPAGAPSDPLSLRWHRTPLPGTAVPAPQPSKGFAAIIESNTREDGQEVTAVCSAMDLSGQNFPYRELRSVVLDSFGDSVQLLGWDTSNKEQGPVIIAATAAGKMYRLPATDVAANTAIYEPREWVCLREDGGVPNEPPALPGWATCRLAPDGNEPDPIVVSSCGQVPWGVEAMEVLPGGRLVALTRDFALVLLRLQPDESPVPISSRSYGSHCTLPRLGAAYAVAHALQTCGGLEDGAYGMEPDGTVLALKACPRELAAARAERYDATAAAGAVPLSRAFSADEAAAVGASGAQTKPWETAEPPTETQSEAAMEIEGPEEVAGGAEESGAFGAPGALVALHRDTTLECMFESGPGEAEGTTGLWPLQRAPGDAAHAAVLLSTSNGARVLAVDGGSVFTDVTDALAVASDRETLAAGNLGLEDWVAQVAAAGVRAFRLGGGGAAPVDWAPPAGATVSSGAVSEGIVILQLMCGGRHALVALALRNNEQGSSGAPTLVQLGALDLAREASCIGNAVLSPESTSAALAVGTYACTVLLLELNLSGSGSSVFSVLGEVVAGRVGYGDFKSMLKEHQGACWTPGSPLAAAKHARGGAAAGGALPFSLVATAAAAPPGHASDYRRDGLQLWVSTRSGDVCALTVGPLPGSAAAGAPPQWGLPFGMHPRCICHGTLPPSLALLPHLPRLGPRFVVLAASRCAALLRLAPGAAALGELPLRLPELARATPLVLTHPSGGERLFLLAATAAGSVSLHSLEPHQRSHAVAHPLEWLPDRMTTHPDLPGVAAVVGRRWHRFPGRGGEANTLSELVVLYVATGQTLHAMGPLTMPAVGEIVTGLVLLPPAALEDERGGGPAGGRFKAFIMATTGTHIERAVLHSGRLLLLGIPAAPAAAPLELLDALNFRDVATSLACHARLDTVDTIVEGSRTMAFVGVGLRLVAYEVSLRGPPSGGQAGRCFQRYAWVPLNAPALRLRVDAQGAVHVSSDDGAAAFSCQELGPQAGEEEPARLPPRPPPRGALTLVRSSPWATLGALGAAASDGTLTVAAGGALVWSQEGQRVPRETAINLGDEGVALAQGRAGGDDDSEEGPAPFAVPTHGGGVYDVTVPLHGMEPEQRAAAAAMLRSLQTALLEGGPGDSDVRDGPAPFLFSRPDPATKQPKNRMFKHPAPLPPAAVSASPEGPEAATAEGPEPPAVVEEQPLVRFLMPPEGDRNGDQPVALDGRVLRRFLEAPRERQQELVQHMAYQERWMPEAAPDARAAAMAYCLVELGVRLLEF